MLKKVSLSLLTSALLIASSGISSIHAANPVTSIYSDVVTNDRLLIPLRTVSENLGADVEWNKEQNSVTINKNETQILLTFNSSTVSVNDTEVTLDAPAQLLAARTYVPLRFVSQTLGADVEWNQKSKQALITLEGTQLRVIMTEPRIEVPNSKKITNRQQQIFIDKLNEATNLASIKQIRTYFRPYFTDRFINELIRNNGFKYNYVLEAANPPHITYITRNTSSFTQGSYEPFGPEQRLSRKVFLAFSNGVWKVDRVTFTLYDEILNP